MVLSACQGTISSLEPTIPGTNCKLTAPPTALVRLTHLQYDNTINELLGLNGEKPSTNFTPDPTFSGFNNSAEGLVVVDKIGRDYRRAAEDLATKVITTPAARAVVVPCTQTTDACAQQFIDTFGRRAFRRPLTSAESSAYFTLFKKGPMLVDGAPDGFTAGVSLTVEAMLQSPNFLYREEVDLDTSTAGIGKLTPYEVASRLSYMLWNNMPDTALLDAAERNQLATPEQLRAQVLRMLADPRAADAIDDFHGQWLDLARYAGIVRDTQLFPAFNANLPAEMQAETLAFTRSVVLEQQPFATLYTANYTYVNADLARVYGMTGINGATLQRVTLDSSKRKGLLTQSGLLASHSYSRTDSPIHRGVFIVRRVLGQVQPDPPPGIDFTLPPLMGTVKTTRDQVTLKTSARDCAGCHTTINAPGFAFGHYDALGQWRTQENGVDIDATGTIRLSGQSVDFTDGLALIDSIATSDEARGSYAKNWFRYSSQRAEGDNDSCELKTLTDGLADPQRPVRELLVDLALLPSFTLRPEVLP
ncbi:MAG: DUF1592 domain-containing protein [Archangium sp.]